MTLTSLTNTTRVANALGEPNALTGQYLAQVEALVPAISRAMEAYLGFPIGWAERSHVFQRVRASTSMLRLPWAFVDTTQDFTLQQDLSRTFSSGEIPTTHYQLNARAGQIIMLVPLLGGAGTVKVTATAGPADKLLSADAATGGLDVSLEEALPEVLEGVTRWVAELYRRKRTSTTTGKSRRGASSSYDPKLLREPPPEVQAMVAHLRRRVLSRR